MAKSPAMTASPCKTIVFLADGMADEPLPELEGKTPLEYAGTPGMDRIASEGRSGTFQSLPEGFPTGSEVANMSVLGCDLATEYGGRGPLEAAGRGLRLQPDDIAFRLNLVSIRDGILTDYAGGHPSQADADSCIRALNDYFVDDPVCFYSGVSYRNLLVLSGSGASAEVVTEKPDDHQGDPVEPCHPRALNSQGQASATLLQRIMREAPAVLAGLNVANNTISGVWPWSGGRAGAIRTLHEKYGIHGAVISAVDVITGLGRCLGMDAIPVEGATGYIDTNYEGKARAAVEALKDHDFVYLHVEAIDEVSHARDLELKIKTIEAFDARVVQTVLEAIGPDVQVAVLPDHPVPVRIGRHTREPVPVSVRRPGAVPDPVSVYSEIAAQNGALGRLAGDALMRLLLG